MVPDAEITLLDILTLVTWLLVLPVVIPMVTGGICGWFIDGLHAPHCVLLGVPVGIANIYWGWLCAFQLWYHYGWRIEELLGIRNTQVGALKLLGITNTEDYVFQVVMWLVAMVIMAAAFVGLLLLLGRFLRTRHVESEIQSR